MEILIFTLFLAVILGWIRLDSYLRERRENRENKRRYFNYCSSTEKQMSNHTKLAKEFFLAASKIRYGAE